MTYEIVSIEPPMIWIFQNGGVKELLGNEALEFMTDNPKKPEPTK